MTFSSQCSQYVNTLRRWLEEICTKIIVSAIRPALKQPTRSVKVITYSVSQWIIYISLFSSTVTMSLSRTIPKMLPSVCEQRVYVTIAYLCSLVSNMKLERMTCRSYYNTMDRILCLHTMWYNVLSDTCLLFHQFSISDNNFTSIELLLQHSTNYSNSSMAVKANAITNNKLLDLHVQYTSIFNIHQ